MRRMWLLLVSFLVVAAFILGGCSPGGCLPGVTVGGDVGELDWVKDKLESMQGEMAELGDNLDWVKGKLNDVMVGLGGVEDTLGEVVSEPAVAGDKKLVGVGMLGESDDQDQWWDTLFIITNTDSEENITADKVVVTREDETLIYSGPYLVYQGGDMEEAEDQVLTPHEVWQLRLSEYKYNPNTGRWIDPEDALYQDLEKYTVEVFWHAEKDTCPLSGWFKQIKTTLVYDHECVLWERYEEWDDYEQRYRYYTECLEWEEISGYQKAVTEASMVNVRQVH